MTDTDLEAALRLDALGEAERITGKSYKEDEDTVGLGMLIHMNNGAKKEAMLIERDDTTFSNRVDRYVRIITERLGFEKLAEFPFFNPNYKGVEDCLYVYYNRATGFVLTFDTYQGRDNTVNSAQVYYNLRMKPEYTYEDVWRVTSSGGYTEDGIHYGYTDAREALVFHVERLLAHFDPITPWVADPMFYLSCHADGDAGNYVHDQAKWREDVSGRLYSTEGTELGDILAVCIQNVREREKRG